MLPTQVVTQCGNRRNISDTQILREINFGTFRVSKMAILTYSEGRGSKAYFQNISAFEIC